MNFSKYAFVIAASLSLCGTASAATIVQQYKAFSHFENGDATETPEHSVWFSGGTNPDGVSGPEGNHFLFENASPGYGLFTVFDDMTATLTGEVANQAGDAFTLEMHLVQSVDPGTYKKASNATDHTLWDFYVLDDTKTSTLNGTLDDFEIALRGAPLEFQLGLGANDKNPLLFGASTWVYFIETSCGESGDPCTTYNGDINILLESVPSNQLPPVPLPAALPLLLSALGFFGFMGWRRKKTAA